MAGLTCSYISAPSRRRGSATWRRTRRWSSTSAKGPRVCRRPTCAGQADSTTTSQKSLERARPSVGRALSRLPFVGEEGGRDEKGFCARGGRGGVGSRVRGGGGAGRCRRRFGADRVRLRPKGGRPAPAG